MLTLLTSTRSLLACAGSLWLFLVLISLGQLISPVPGAGFTHSDRTIALATLSVVVVLCAILGLGYLSRRIYRESIALAAELQSKLIALDQQQTIIHCIPHTTWLSSQPQRVSMVLHYYEPHGRYDQALEVQAVDTLDTTQLISVTNAADFANVANVIDWCATDQITDDSAWTIQFPCQPETASQAA
ncbi:MAG: hypothetical protein IT423_21460 [Pirellulaceae bacterium]|nr:hypothetical protein [Pirellulaceae bacterium]